MVEKAALNSKVLVIDSNKEIFPVTRLFCEETHLIGLRANKSNVMAVLRTHVDLGAILLAESYNDDPQGGIALARQIHQLRPELPIFLRRERHEELDDLPPDTRRLFCAAYTIGSMHRLHQYVDEYIFSRIYPNVMVRGIREITEDVLQGRFPNAAVTCDTPYVVRDRIIMGDVFSLIPIESSWCRGYMMIQATEAAAATSSFGAIAEHLGEITNLVWGSFKNRYIADPTTPNATQTQVPILVRLNQKSISFGAEDPQLCFKYALTDRTEPEAPPVYLFQRFVFNLRWSPEDFTEVPNSAEDLVAAGELEFF
ncbi:hypothetical protein DLREEDagrD3_12690 [Denitratisoma sp. agr-D3]